MSIHGLINKKNIKEWLSYLGQTPLYIHHDIKIDITFLSNYEVATELVMDDLSEHVPIEDNNKLFFGMKTNFCI